MTGAGTVTAPVSAPTTEEFKREFLEYLRDQRGVLLGYASPNDCYQALAHTVRRRLVQAWIDTIETQLVGRARFVFYLSAEYLLGRQLENALLHTGLGDTARRALADLGLDLDALAAVEREPGLGNGGLGRLAACFLDSLATLGIPAVGYGIRYEFGIFRQAFVDGAQVEQPDEWLRLGCPWEFPHPELAEIVGFGGSTEHRLDSAGRLEVRWHPERTIVGVPYNILIPGYGGTVNTLRLWSARSPQEFNLQIFNDGDYTRAVQDKIASENLTKVLYPDDRTSQGKELRLAQQYFFVACSIAEIVRQLRRWPGSGTASDGSDGDVLDQLPDRAVIQLNDTHPVIAIPELMRLLVDEQGWSWERAWAVCTRVFAYTCHTLLPEALETWPVALLGRLLPRHLEIITEIDRRFRNEVARRRPGDDERIARMAIVSDGPDPVVRMAHLAVVGSFKVNGVAELHSALLRDHVLADFAALWPERFVNVTNGVTPRRFLRLANPDLSELITGAIGDGWVTDLGRLRELEPLTDDPAFRDAWLNVKHDNKARLAAAVRSADGPALDPSALFDVLVKRIHLYKRQLLKVLHVITAYHRLLDDPQSAVPSRLVLFGGKAAPGYFLAKQVVRLINGVADVVNNEPLLGGRLRVDYLPNYDVSAAQVVIPAADLSEQISTAGKEASGTGNMKLALNGALTIGTLDGANVEIRDLVGPENFFLFGMTEEDVRMAQAAGYRPWIRYESDDELRRAVDAIASGRFTPEDPEALRPLVDDLLGHDEFLVLADYRSYIDAQDDVDAAWADRGGWARRSILNTARCGFFSSDRAINDYLRQIWRAVPFRP
jgi:glycogen phosphorylase